jgi:hypothetical protein
MRNERGTDCNRLTTLKHNIFATTAGPSLPFGCTGHASQEGPFKGVPGVLVSKLSKKSSSTTRMVAKMITPDHQARIDPIRSGQEKLGGELSRFVRGRLQLKRLGRASSKEERRGPRDGRSRRVPAEGGGCHGGVLGQSNGVDGCSCKTAVQKLLSDVSKDTLRMTASRRLRTARREPMLAGVGMSNTLRPRRTLESVVPTRLDGPRSHS